MRHETKYRGTAVQLRLLPGTAPEPDWRVDERTREVGRQGVAQAREILRRIAARQAGSEHTTNPTEPPAYPAGRARERTSV